ncbi:MAG: tetratricopeptide repeat protein [Acidobacteriota bacterium]
MAFRPAEMSFQKGLRALEARRYLEGLAYFESALNLEERMGISSAGRVRYLSYYGLALSLAAGRTEDAIEMCKRAVAVEFYNPDLYLNLARVYLSAGELRKAHRATVRGLHLEGRHPGLLAIRKRMGMRRRPAFTFLPRRHVLNRLTGKLATRLR